MLRDRHGIPHIYAASLDDAYFALGFVHAQDRLWQMEMSRRIGSGRLAEILGANALEADRFMRTLGLRHVAHENLRHYDAETRRVLEAEVAKIVAESGQQVDYKFGTMIEVPRGALTADQIAEHA
ncbi:MAG: penicillin acylase family protein, partial [Burkholderiales bacterium]